MFIYWSFRTPEDQYTKTNVGGPRRLLPPHPHSLLHRDPLVAHVARGALMAGRSRGQNIPPWSFDRYRARRACHCAAAVHQREPLQGPGDRVDEQRPRASRDLRFDRTAPASSTGLLSRKRQPSAMTPPTALEPSCTPKSDRLPRPQLALARTAGDRAAETELPQPQSGRAQRCQLEPRVPSVERPRAPKPRLPRLRYPARVRAFPTSRPPMAASTSNTDWKKVSSPSPMLTSPSGARRKTSGA